MSEQQLTARLDEGLAPGRAISREPAVGEPELFEREPRAGSRQLAAEAIEQRRSAASAALDDTRRQRRVRKVDLAKARYRYAGQVGGEIAGALFWLFFWVLNGACTAYFLHSLGAPWSAGVLAHLVISVIEQHLWLSRRLSAYLLVLLVGVVDVLTSALGVLLVLRWLGVAVEGWQVLALATVLAELIAIVPEPLLIEHGIAVRRLLARR